MDHQAISAILGNYGEFIGAAAVVATLIYVAIQIRQNSMQLRLNIFQTATGQFYEFWVDVAENQRTFEACRGG